MNPYDWDELFGRGEREWGQSQEGAGGWAYAFFKNEWQCYPIFCLARLGWLKALYQLFWYSPITNATSIAPHDERMPTRGRNTKYSFSTTAFETCQCGVSPALLREVASETEDDSTGLPASFFDRWFMAECHPDRDEQPKQTVVPAAQTKVEQTYLFPEHQSFIFGNFRIQQTWGYACSIRPNPWSSWLSQPRNNTQKRTQFAKEESGSAPNTSTSVITPMVQSDHSTGLPSGEYKDLPFIFYFCM